LHSKLSVQDYERLGHRVQNALRVLPLVNRLRHTGAEGCDIRERDDGSLNSFVNRCRIRRYPDNEPSVTASDFMLARRPVSDRLLTQLLNIFDIA
jgi:hypothetical protein